jgi:hypothetical protein
VSARKSPLSESETKGLENANKGHRELREQWQRLAQVMLAAVACRDVNFFEHVAEIIAVRGYERFMVEPPLAVPERVAVASALQSLKEDDEICQLLTRKPEYKELCRAMQLEIAHNDLGIRSKTTFRPVEIEEKMLKHAAFKALLPDGWESLSADTRERTIRRHAQELGIKLKRGNARS